MSLVDFLVSLVILLALMVWYGFVPDWHVVALPLFLLLAFVVAFGLGLWFAALNVRTATSATSSRSSPVRAVRLAGRLQQRGRAASAGELLYALNPMVGVIDGFRWSLLGDDAARPAGRRDRRSAVGVVMLAGGVGYFRATERTFADVI